MTPFFYLTEPFQGHKDYGVYASISHVGTWDAAGSHCDVCNRTSYRLVPPLLIEWDPGSDIVGSLSWRGYTAVATGEAKLAIEAIGDDFDYQEVQVVAPTSKRHRQRRVPFPYDGPALHWLHPKRTISIDPVASKLTQIPACSVCGRGTSWRFKREGLVVQYLPTGYGAFRIEELWSDAIFVTERWLRAAQSAGLSNIGFELAGEVRALP